MHLGTLINYVSTVKKSDRSHVVLWAKELTRDFVFLRPLGLRLLYFAEKADTEGAEEVASLFRNIANGETKHAFGHFDQLRINGEEVGS